MAGGDGGVMQLADVTLDQRPWVDQLAATLHNHVIVNEDNAVQDIGKEGRKIIASIVQLRGMRSQQAGGTGCDSDARALKMRMRPATHDSLKTSTLPELAARSMH